MTALRCVTDLRGKGKWTAADYARKADLWIVADTWQERPKVEGRVLAYINPCVNFFDGVAVGEPGTFTGAIKGLPLLPLKPLWRSQDEPWWTPDMPKQVLCAIDIAKRGVVTTFLNAVRDHLSWADGVEFCYGTSLEGWDPGRYPLEFWDMWFRILAGIASSLRSLHPDWTLVWQEFHITPPTTNTNGLYLEGNGPYDFRQTPAMHEKDLADFKLVMNIADKMREIVWVQEIRRPELYTPEALASVVAWADRLGLYVSLGRDATSRGAA